MNTELYYWDETSPNSSFCKEIPNIGFPEKKKKVNRDIEPEESDNSEAENEETGGNVENDTDGEQSAESDCGKENQCKYDT